MSLKVKRISCAFLAVWLLVSSVGLALDVHFCNGNIFSIGINASAISCSMSDDSESPTTKTIKKKSCCDQERAYCQKGVDSLSGGQLMEFRAQPLADLTFQEINLFRTGNRGNCFQDISPPSLSTCELHILLSTFRI